MSVVVGQKREQAISTVGADAIQFEAFGHEREEFFCWNEVIHINDVANVAAVSDESAAGKVLGADDADAEALRVERDLSAQRELADVERRLSKHKKSLPLLGEIRIASPCNADWKAMTGDEQTRFCDKCAKNVYNLSAMTTVQAEALIREKEGDLCVRYYQRADGTVMTTDCSVGLRRKRIKTVAFVAAVGAAAAGGVFAMEESMVMGAMAESDTRMGKLEAADWGPAEDEHLRTTLGAITNPDDLSHGEENTDDVVERVDSNTKSKTPVYAVPRNVPQRP